MSERQHHIAAIGSNLIQIGESLIALARLDAMEQGTDTGTLRDHYSQEARDARQYPVLALFAEAPTLSLSWEREVKPVALNNGYTSMGLGGFFTGPNALLVYTDDSKSRVRITQSGLNRLAEIKERGLVSTAA